MTNIDNSQATAPPGSTRLSWRRRRSAACACVVRDANMGHQLADGNRSWCPELESRTTHHLAFSEVLATDPNDSAAGWPARAGRQLDAEHSTVDPRRGTACKKSHPTSAEQHGPNQTRRVVGAALHLACGSWR